MPGSGRPGSARPPPLLRPQPAAPPPSCTSASRCHSALAEFALSRRALASHARGAVGHRCTKPCCCGWEEPRRSACCMHRASPSCLQTFLQGMFLVSAPAPCSQRVPFCENKAQGSGATSTLSCCRLPQRILPKAPQLLLPLAGVQTPALLPTQAGSVASCKFRLHFWSL